MLKLLRSPYITLTRGISTSSKILNVETPKVLVPETPSVITSADIYKEVKFIDTVKPRQHYDPHYVAPVSQSVQAKVASPFPNYIQAWLKDFKTNEPLDLLNISSQVFGAPLRRDLIHRAVVFERDGLRQGTQSAKNRAEVSGTGKKAFPQKKRGKARVGSLRAPQFRGGGMAFPPKPRDHSTDLQVKVLHYAFRSLLSTKYAQNQLIIVDKILPSSSKTKDLAAILNAHNWNNSYIIAGEQNENLHLASKNIEKLLVGDIYTPKVYQMMLHHNLILDLSALAHFEYLLSTE